MRDADVIIVGAGIVGLAVARQITEQTAEARVIVLEKEHDIALHQTGRNSGVLHSGIYYKPGSLKATNCRRGKELMERFCREHGIPFDLCGKVIVATHQRELERLNNIVDRGKRNGIACRMIDAAELRAYEPHAAGIRAIHVPGAGIVDFTGVCRALCEIIRERGGEVICNARVARIERHGHDGATVHTDSGLSLQANHLFLCGGLYSDRLAHMAGIDTSVTIVPFRGEYYELHDGAKHLCRNLIYPTPDPAFPFLGVHFTRMIEGGVECGPNAVLAMAREGYTRTSIHLGELTGTLINPAFWSIAGKYWRTGAGEVWRSLSKRAFVRALQRLVPEIRSEHLSPAPAGVRAQALGRDGKLLDDFAIERDGPITCVLNAPSPAATSALAVAETIVVEMDAGS